MVKGLSKLEMVKLTGKTNEQRRVLASMGTKRHLQDTVMVITLIKKYMVLCAEARCDYFTLNSR